MRTTLDNTTTRRAFLKTCGYLAIGVSGAGALLAPLREAIAGSIQWTPIPDQTWAIGAPVSLDLANYCTSPSGRHLTFSLNQPLPAGLSLSGSVISGVPTSVFSTASFVATADDASLTGVGTDEGANATIHPHLSASPNPSSGPVRFLGERRGTSAMAGVLRVFAVTGRLVHEREFPVGGWRYEVGWDGRGKDGARLPSGVYIATVTVGAETTRARFVLAH